MLRCSILFLAACGLALAQGPYDLTVKLNGMNPHVGQMLPLRVLELPDSIQVAADTVDTLEVIDSLTFQGILDSGKSYLVDFFADLNKNGQYDAPPADHAWRETLDSVQANQTILFTHHIAFTDIQYMDAPTAIMPGSHADAPAYLSPGLYGRRQMFTLSGRRLEGRNGTEALRPVIRAGKSGKRDGDIYLSYP